MSRCQHENTRAKRDHVACLDCGAVCPDSGWGIARGQWFPSLDVARFYEANGRLPEALSQPQAASSTQAGEPRFFIEHGMVHDRQTGKHLADMNPAALLELLRRLEIDRDAWRATAKAMGAASSTTPGSSSMGSQGLSVASSPIGSDATVAGSTPAATPSIGSSTGAVAYIVHSADAVSRFELTQEGMSLGYGRHAVYATRAPGVDDAMVERAYKASRTGWHQNEMTQMRAALEAALAQPAQQGERGAE